MRANEFVLEYKEQSLEEFEGLSFKMVKKGHQLIVTALDDWGNNELGYVIFNIGDNDELDPQDLEVDDRYRGQGIARVMYDYVTSKGYEIHRSYDQTPAGKGFWDKHRGEEVRVWEGMFDVFKPKMKFNVETAGEELYVDVTLGKEQIAGFTFDMFGNDLEAQDMSVVAKYRGQGIARQVYDMLKANGYRINRSQYQTPAGAHFWNKNRGEDVRVWESIDAEQMLDYVKRTHSPEEFNIEYAVTDHPKWELKNVPLSHLKLDPDGEERDPYNRVNWVDYDTVNELVPKIVAILKSKPIVVDSHGWIIDGNHRATAAVEAGLKSIPAYVPAKVKKNELNESLSRVAYHYTNIGSALKILKSGQFELSSAPGSIEQQYAPKGKHYFLSTTRTKLGDFHRNRGSTYGVIFVLDGDWFNQNYKSGPVDYWGNRNPQTSSHRGHEAEDRVFSSEPTIPISGVTAIHVLATKDSAMPSYNAIVRDILIQAKALGIPAYFYDRPTPWMNLDTRHLGDVSMLKGQAPVNTYFPARGKLKPHYLEHWIELMMKNDQSKLSKKADQMRYSLNYTYDLQDAVDALSNEFANARKPDSGPERGAVIKIIAYMKKHKLNTIADFVNHMAAKWKQITQTSKQS